MHGCTEPLNVKRIIFSQEFDEIDAGEVASGIVKEQILTARIAGVNPSCLLASVPFLNSIVKLHARVGASPRRMRDFVHEVPRVILGGDFATRAIRRLPRIALEIRIHEDIRDADGVVAVLPTDGAVCLAVEICRIPGGDECLRLLFLTQFPLNIVNNLRMLHVENHHFRGTSRCPTGLDAPCPPVEPF